MITHVLTKPEGVKQKHSFNEAMASIENVIMDTQKLIILLLNLAASRQIIFQPLLKQQIHLDFSFK